MGIEEGEESEEGIENHLKKTHTISGSSESPKEVGPKEVYTEMHH